MTWQTETCNGTLTYREALTSWVAVMTSKHVSAVAVNAGGTGHSVGDVITISHASGYHPLRLEVTAVSAGVITAVRINTGGAFAERCASAVVNAGGTGYAVGDVLEVQDGAGASTCKAKFKVATLSGSAVATVTLFEDGGAYSTTPTTTAAATLNIGPDGAAGSGCTLDLTMQSIIGTSAIAQTSTTGSGINATFDLTLTATGWSTLYNKNESTAGTAGDDLEKEVVLLGTVSTGDAPIIGFQTVQGSSGAEDRWCIAAYGMTAFNSGLALTAQPNIGPLAWTLGTTSGAQILVTDEVAEGNSWWISATGRRVYGCIRGNISGESDNYHTFYVGLANQYGTATTSPYPMVVGGSSYNWNQRTSNLDHTGLAECWQPAAGSGPVYFLRKTDLTWQSVENGVNTSISQQHVMWPRGAISDNTDGANQIVTDENFRRLTNDGVISSCVRANLSDWHYPAPGTNDEFVLHELTIISRGDSAGTDDIHTHIIGELDGCFWTGGTKADGTIFTAEDYIENAAGDRYRAFPCNTESLSARRYQFMLMRED